MSESDGVACEAGAGQAAVCRVTYTIDEAAALLGISRNSAYEAARSGELKTIKFGKRILVPRAFIRDLIGGSSA